MKYPAVELVKVLQLISHSALFMVNWDVGFMRSVVRLIVVVKVKANV